MKHLKLILLAFLITSCAATTSLVVTGESLKGVGNEFVVVARVYKEGCDLTKTIPPSQCAKFTAFGKEFQKAYPLTIQLWEAARTANDAAAQEQLDKLVVQLAADLSAFAVAVIKTYGEGGK